MALVVLIVSANNSSLWNCAWNAQGLWLFEQRDCQLWRRVQVASRFRTDPIVNANNSQHLCLTVGDLGTSRYASVIGGHLWLSRVPSPTAQIARASNPVGATAMWGRADWTGCGAMRTSPAGIRETDVRGSRPPNWPPSACCRSCWARRAGVPRMRSWPFRSWGIGRVRAKSPGGQLRVTLHQGAVAEPWPTCGSTRRPMVCAAVDGTVGCRQDSCAARALGIGSRGPRTRRSSRGHRADWSRERRSFSEKEASWSNCGAEAQSGSGDEGAGGRACACGAGMQGLEPAFPSR